MPGGPSVDRRTFLYGSASTLALSAVGVGAVTAFQAGASAAGPERFPYRMAMHIHSCFSEGDGSMEAHLAQAEQEGIAVVWWTEHDHRMVARGYIKAINFDSFTEYDNGGSLTWRSRYEGSLATSSAAIVTNPASPNDPGGRALRITATSRPDETGTRRIWADAKNDCLTTSLTDTIIAIEVYPQQLNEDGWADVRIETSYRPAREGRVAGQYSVIYRIGGARPKGTRELINDLTALVVVGAKNGNWKALEFNPVADLNSFWPAVNFQDSGLTEFTLSTTSRNGQAAKATFDGLRFIRSGRTAEQVVATQRQLMDGYATAFPTVVQHQGMEVSESTPHLNWFGNTDIWSSSDPANHDVGLAVRTIHQANGLVSYNHPYGSSGGPYSTSQRTSKRRSVTSTLVQELAFKADCLEVGYLGGRAGMQLSDYIDLWDVLSRNAIFITGTGATDDHHGRAWREQQWRCATGVWATGTELDPLQRALNEGRAWFADMSRFSGSLDLTAEGYVGMGQAALVTQAKSRLAISIVGAEPDWSVRVVMGVVDEPGVAELDPRVTRKTFSMAEAVDGVLLLTVNTTISRFYRVELANAAGVVVAYSNPVWLLTQLPVNTIPAARWAEPPVDPTPTDPEPPPGL